MSKILYISAVFISILMATWWQFSVKNQTTTDAGTDQNTLINRPQGMAPITLESQKLPSEVIPKGADPFQVHLNKQKDPANRSAVTVVNEAPPTASGTDPFKALLESQNEKQKESGVSPFGSYTAKPSR
jgi:hypothetical protein